MKQKIILYKCITIFSLVIIIFPFRAWARENITDWYIKDFQTEIIVNKDSTLDITEKITADCGNLSGKHGIFRILPEAVNLSGGGSIKMPVELIGITDFSGKHLKYEETRNSADHTVTWKIGDANKTVSGVNNYKITYHVKNAVRFGSPDFDEFYWNLNGNFWDIETDKFHASIIFPSEVSKDNSTVEYYTGYLGGKGKDLASYRWSAPNIVEFDSTRNLLERQGITASIIFPKNIFTPYKFSFWELYGRYLWFLLPTVVLFWCFRYWWRYGRDPKVDKTIIAQYDPPGNMTPIEMGILDNGGFYNELVTAEIVNLATKGLLTIKEVSNKILLFNIKDCSLARKHDKEKEKNLIAPQKKILEKIFRDGDQINLSDLKPNFPEILSSVEKEAMKCIVDRNFITASGQRNMTMFATAGILALIAAFFMFISSVGFDFPVPWYISSNILLSGVILIIFGILMKKRTPEGAEKAWEVKGFKLFMETVDKDRAKFYEKENIFEKFLPYAIMFGITDVWIKRMREIYGDNYFASHAPAWYIGGSAAAFNADSLENTIGSLSSSIATNASSSSGSGGGGSSGGGGGGGGGGGW